MLSSDELVLVLYNKLLGLYASALKLVNMLRVRGVSCEVEQIELYPDVSYPAAITGVQRLCYVDIRDTKRAVCLVDKKLSETLVDRCKTARTLCALIKKLQHLKEVIEDEIRKLERGTLTTCTVNIKLQDVRENAATCYSCETCFAAELTLVLLNMMRERIMT